MLACVGGCVRCVGRGGRRGYVYRSIQRRSFSNSRTFVVANPPHFLKKLGKKKMTKKCEELANSRAWCWFILTATQHRGGLWRCITLGVEETQVDVLLLWDWCLLLLHKSFYSRSSSILLVERTENTLTFSYSHRYSSAEYNRCLASCCCETAVACSPPAYTSRSNRFIVPPHTGQTPCSSLVVSAVRIRSTTTRRVQSSSSTRTRGVVKHGLDLGVK